MNEYEIAGIETIARGVVIRDGRLLLCRAKGSKTSYLPGGHIEFGETGRQALVREMREETGLAVTTGRFLGVVENSFLQHGKPHAEINLVYAMELDDPSAAVTSCEDWITFEWCPLADLSAAGLLPEAFRKLGTDPRTLGTDPRTLDPRTLGTTPRTLGTDPRTLDPRTLGTDPENVFFAP